MTHAQQIITEATEAIQRNLDAGCYVSALLGIIRNQQAEINRLNRLVKTEVAQPACGRWIVTESIPTLEKTVECSACRCKSYYPKALWAAIRLTDYCPHCGAKMDQE